MNIGLLSMDYPPRMAGGTTVHTYQLARGLAELGHRPYVVSLRHKGCPREEHGDVEVRRVPMPYTIFSALKMRSLTQEVDVVHGHGICSYGFMRLHRFPIVVKMHNTWLAEYALYRKMGLSTGLMRLYVHMDRFCATKAGALIAISHAVKDEVMRYGIPEEQITVIHNGIDLRSFENARSRKEELGIENAIVLAYIGRLVPHKGAFQVANAFAELTKRHDDVFLLIVGDGPERKRMEAVLVELMDKVRFTGFVEHELIPDYYATADIIVLPTIYEPLGNVVLESMAAGRPIIASMTGGIPEILPEECGILIDPPGDVSSTLEAMDQLVTSESLRKSMGRRAREEARKYSWEKVCTRTVEVLEGVLRA